MLNRRAGSFTLEFTWWRAVGCIVFAILCVGCGTSDPPDWKTVLATVAKTRVPEEIKPPPPTTNHLVVYLDTSASMAGYVSPDKQGQTTFSHALQELRNFSTMLTPPLEILVRRVDSSVGPPLNDSILSVASVNQGLFIGKETDLAGAIGLFRKGVEERRPQSEEERDAHSLPPARFHILVTDGVQSKRHQQKADSPCIAGSDQICVRKKILELLNEGWGGCVIGMRSEFKGKIYSEISGAALRYETRNRDPKTFRPFYLYMFSPDPAALDSLVEVLKERLRPMVGQDDVIREAALTSPYTSGFARGDATIPKDRSEALELSQAREENPARFTLRIDVDTEKTGPKPFTISMAVPWSNHAQYGGTPQELANLVRWELTPVYPNGTGQSGTPERVRYPEIKIVGQQVENDGRVVLQATAQWPRATGDLAWCVYKLEGRLNLERQTPLWVQQWSTNLDTTAEVGNRTLNLESVLLGLWHNDILKRQVVAEVYVRVGPQ